MQQFEFKIIPAPRRAEKARGLKTTADRFAQTLAQVMNDLAREGWEYLRADTLPCEERTGLTGKSTSYQTMLIFRRAVTAKVAEPVAAENADCGRDHDTLDRCLRTGPAGGHQ